MKKMITLALILLSSLISAEFNNIEIREFKGSFYGEEGSGTASVFNIANNIYQFKSFTPEIEIGAKVNLNILRENDGYRFTYGNNEYIYQSPPEFIWNINSLKWSNISLVSKSNQFMFKLDQLITNSGEFNGSIEKLYLKCLNYKSDLLKSCLTNATLLLKEYYSKDGDSSATSIENVHFSVKNNNFKLSAKLNLDISLNIKAVGQTKYDPVQNQIAIRVDKVKAGWFTITDRVFNEVEKMNKEGVTVRRPYIYYDLN